jgi:DNA-binding MarR family transcriptional regulator
MIKPARRDASHHAPHDGGSKDVAPLVLALLPTLTRHLQRELRERGTISLERFKALRALEDGPLRSGALAARLRLSPGALTRLADGLVADRLVARIGEPTDRRMVYVELTDVGRAELLHGEGVLIEAVDELLRNLSRAQRSRLASALDDLRGALEAEVRPAAAIAR